MADFLASSRLYAEMPAGPPRKDKQQYSVIPIYIDIAILMPILGALFVREADPLLASMRVPRLIAIIYGLPAARLYPFSSFIKRLLTTADTTLRVEFDPALAVNAARVFCRYRINERL
jgi:hypothetical protein